MEGRVVGENVEPSGGGLALQMIGESEAINEGIEPILNPSKSAVSKFG